MPCSTAPAAMLMVNTVTWNGISTARHVSVDELTENTTAGVITGHGCHGGVPQIYDAGVSDAWVGCEAGVPHRVMTQRYDVG